MCRGRRSRSSGSAPGPVMVPGIVSVWCAGFGRGPGADLPVAAHLSARHPRVRVLILQAPHRTGAYGDPRGGGAEPDPRWTGPRTPTQTRIRPVRSAPGTAGARRPPRSTVTMAGGRTTRRPALPPAKDRNHVLLIKVLLTGFGRCTRRARVVLAKAVPLIRRAISRRKLRLTWPSSSSAIARLAAPRLGRPLRPVPAIQRASEPPPATIATSTQPEP